MKTSLSRQVRARLWFVAVGLALAAACSSTGTPDSTDTSGAVGTGGTLAKGGATSHGGASAAAGAGVGAGAGAGGTSTGAGGGLHFMDAGSDSAVDGAGLQDALPDVATDACLTTGMLPPGPVVRTCAPPTDNECNGLTDVNAALPNGMYGNGFDDDCDGKVDEGCECDAAHLPGTTRDCYLTPSSQVDPTTLLPVGWCTMNSKGTEACDPGSGEMGKPTWDGYCKGATAPFPDDVCAPGDYNCDGTPANPSMTDCSCGTPVVQCPMAPIVISPYPNPHDITMKKPNPYDPDPNTPFIIDGSSWIQNAMGMQATGWKWTITGGDCDNILPFPTFAIYNGPDTTAGGIGRFGTLATNIGSNGAQHGLVFGPVDDGQMGASAHQIWPAFSLSGDYVIEGDFMLDGMNYSCTVQVQVRAPGLRAEMCWDIGATATGLGTNSSDLDLHFARLQGGSGSPHGWFGTAGTAPSSDDCFYECSSGCRTGNLGYCGPGNADEPTPAPGWGYAASPDASCHGWGSRRESQQSCDNPRLDLDDYQCAVNVNNPVDPSFCGPENINIDDPNAGDQFAVGVHYYSGTKPQHPHVNIYCNGQRQLALGYDPTTTPAITKPEFSQAYTTPSTLTTYAYSGDFWEVARVTWSGDAMNPCTIEPIPSAAPKADKDGASNSCVDTNAQNSPAEAKPKTQDWYFEQSKGYPTAPASPPSALCWH